ncbi:MAG: Phosphoheptose isomerase [Chlamydiae bacterium]|nr:Phosphoheptose isomerase [Chlamydiota bacterium]
MKKEILEAIEGGVEAIEFLKTPSALSFIEEASAALAECFASGGKLLIAGNGGSLCDAMHFAEELTGVFREKRPALPAIALACPGHLTCTGNDLGFDQVFARGVEAYGRPGDILAVLTTSGNSPNIVEAVAAAKEKGVKTLAFLGKDGGALRGQTDLELCIPGSGYSDRIQEAHMTAIHIIIQMVEQRLFHESPAPLARNH